MTRLLTETEIENMLDFIQPQKGIPYDTAMSVVNSLKTRLRHQLCKQKVYPEIIPALKDELFHSYRDSIIQSGESVGVVCAQSIGEKQTQTTLNSIDWQDKILYVYNGSVVIEPIGQMIDNILQQFPENITRIETNRTDYLPLPHGYKIPSCNENGNTEWYRIEAVTRHLPVGKLVNVITESGRSITATQSKSFLVWNGTKFESINGSDIKVGDILPTTKKLKKSTVNSHLDMETIFPKSKYLYTSEIIKARQYILNKNQEWIKNNNLKFTIPSGQPNIYLHKHKNFFLTCEPSLVYIYSSNKFLSPFPDRIVLDCNFGFFVGLYLSKGWCIKSLIRISNDNPIIIKRITNFCDHFEITYSLHTRKCAMGESNKFIKIHSKLMARMIKIICYMGSTNKHVPELAYNAPNDFIKGLLDGYYSGASMIDDKNGTIMVSSKTEMLLTGISFLLSYFGVFGRVLTQKIRNNKFGSKNIYILSMSKDYSQKFAEQFCLSDTQKQLKITNILLNKDYIKVYEKSQFPDCDVYFDRVVSVKYVEGTTEYVYDLTVEVTRNFQLWNGLNCRDTFHKAGQSEKTMTTGVPRFKELLDATKNPKIINHKIYFRGNNSTVQETRAIVGNTIVGFTMADIATSITVKMNKTEEFWYNAYKILFDDKFENHQHCISFKLDMNKLYEFKLDMKQIADCIHNEYSDLFCVFSPPSEGQLDIFVNTENIILPENRLLFVNQENAIMIYMEEVVQVTLEKKYICGIPAITDVFYTRDNNEWIVETVSFSNKKISNQYSSYKRILAHPNVDYTRTISNNVWDIYEVLDIEAARQFLFEEFMNIMEGINECHSMLLVDRMTHMGTISSITRYTLKKEESGPMGKASFEETMDNFLNAAAQGDREPTEGVSASIICGKKASIGTGMIQLAIDIPMLPQVKQELNDIDKKVRELKLDSKCDNNFSSNKNLTPNQENNSDDDDDEIPAFIEI